VKFIQTIDNVLHKFSSVDLFNLLYLLVPVVWMCHFWIWNFT